jgi:organic hydroperoxide reductase OsmC/OhrA
MSEHKVTFSWKRETPDFTLARMHEQAHNACFIARSVKTEVVVEPQ